MRFLTILVLIPLLGYGLLTGYMWYEVKSNLDAGIEAVSEHIDVTYESIHTSLNGEAGVNGLILRPRITWDEFKIDKVRISADNLYQLARARSAFKNQSWPEQLTISIEQANIPFDSELLKMLDQAQMQEASEQKQGFDLEQLTALGCGELKRFSGEDYVKMGYDKMLLNVKLVSRTSPYSGDTDLEFSAADQDLWNVKFTTSANFERLKQNPAVLAEGISEALLEYNDTGFYRLRNSYCASLMNKTEQEFIANNAKLTNKALGASLPLELINAYRQYVQQGGYMMVSLHPRNTASLLNLNNASVNEIINALGLSMSINDVIVDFSKIDFDAANKPTRKASRKATTPPRSNVRVVKRPVTRPAKTPVAKANPAGKSPPRYRSVTTSELATLLGRRAKITTNSGMLREGYLNSIHDGEVEILQELSGGEFSYPVKLKEIASAQVLY